jgi:hypothetical protein
MFDDLPHLALGAMSVIDNIRLRRLIQSDALLQIERYFKELVEDYRADPSRPSLQVSLLIGETLMESGRLEKDPYQLTSWVTVYDKLEDLVWDIARYKEYAFKPMDAEGERLAKELITFFDKLINRIRAQDHRGPRPRFLFGAPA